MANLSNINNKFIVASDGKVGIGTTVLNAISGTNPTLTLGGTGISGGLILQKAGTDTARLYENAGNMVHQGMTGIGHHFYVNAATQAMVIDTSGNVGINGASNFGSDNKAIQLINGVYSGAFQIDSIGNVGLAQNAYQDGIWKYYQTNEAAILNLEDGQFKFFNAASGTAGAAITFSERMRIDSSGNVGIGTDDPQSKLHIQTDAAPTDIYLTDGTVGTDNYGGVIRGYSVTGQGGRLQLGTLDNDIYYPAITVLQQGGNVGIGTTTPGQKLEVIGNISSGLSSTTTRTALIANTFGYSTSWKTLTLGSAGTNYQTDAVSLCFNVLLNQNSSGLYSGDGSEYFWRNTGSFKTPNSGNNGYNTILSWNSSGQPYFSNNVGIGTTSPSATFQVNGNTNFGNAAQPANTSNYINNFNNDLALLIKKISTGVGDYLSIQDSTGSSKFIVKSSGNVGIGTTSPGAKLEINNGSTQTELRISVTGDTGYSTINFADASDINPGQIYYHHQQNLMNFRTNDNDRMVINSSGNVGIGTTGPPSKLTVMESTLCTNSGTDGGTSYVPAKPILLVTTDGNGTPSGNYATNSVFTVGIGGGITGGVTTKHLSVLLNGKVNIGTGTSVTGWLNIEKTGNHIHLRNSGATSGKYWNFDVASNNRLYILDDGNTGVYIADGATSWTGVSDETLKENVKPLENVLDKIKDYRCVEYNLKSVPSDKKIGFIAQDWKEDYPQIVDKDDDGLLGMKYTETIPVLLKAIQELKAEIELLKSK